MIAKQWKSFFFLNESKLKITNSNKQTFFFCLFVLFCFCLHDDNDSSNSIDYHHHYYKDDDDDNQQPKQVNRREKSEEKKIFFIGSTQTIVNDNKTKQNKNVHANYSC